MAITALEEYRSLIDVIYHLPYTLEGLQVLQEFSRGYGGAFLDRVRKWGKSPGVG